MNYSTKALNILGYHSKQVPNTFLKQDNETNHLVILFPGVSYTCQMPLLYYQTKLFLSLGADVLCVEYAYIGRTDFQSLPDSEQENWFHADVTSSCRIGLEQRAYSKVTLSGKSLGTLAVGHLLTSEPMLSHATAIWLTPVLKDEKLRIQIPRTKQRCLLIIGTRDQYYDVAYMESLKIHPHMKTVILEGADHSLEIKDDLSSSIKIMDQVIQEIERFVSPSRQQRR